MKYFRVSLVTVKSLISCPGIEAKIKTGSINGSGEDEIRTIFLKSDIYDLFQPVLACDHSQIIILYTSYITQVYFAFNLFTKCIVIFKI